MSVCGCEGGDVVAILEKFGEMWRCVEEAERVGDNENTEEVQTIDAQWEGMI